MATAADIGYGTTFTWHAVVIGEVTRIGSVTLTVSKQDATTLASPDAHKEYLPGLIDPGDVDLEGWLDPDDAGQVLLLADMNARTEQAWIITFPVGVSSAVWNGNGYCIGFSAGDATPEGLVPFTATIALSNKPTLTP